MTHKLSFTVELTDEQEAALQAECDAFNARVRAQPDCNPELGDGQWDLDRYLNATLPLLLQKELMAKAREAAKAGAT